MQTIYIYMKSGGKIIFPRVNTNTNPILRQVRPDITSKSFYLVSEDASTVSALWGQISRITSWQPDGALLMEKELWNSRALVAEIP